MPPRWDRRRLRRRLNLLHCAYGPHGWWPTTPAGATEPVYVPGRAFSDLREKDRLEICLGAILTQNTSWSNVVTALRSLQSEGRLSVEKVRKIPRRRLHRLLRSSGYFRQKTARIQTFLEAVKTRAGGSVTRWLRGATPEVRERLLALNGIGPETADSMLLYAGGHRIFVVDAYTRRIAARWGVLQGKESYDQVRALFEDALPRSPAVYGETHAGLVQLGKEFCRPQPRCGDCPLRHQCEVGRRRRAVTKRRNS